MNVLSLVEREDRQDPDWLWFQADPNEIYPHALAWLRCRDQLKGLPQNLTRRLFTLPLDQIAVAYIPRDRFDRSDRPHNIVMAELAVRAEFLECARLVFTELLHQQIGRPIGLHLIRRPAWRL